MEKKEHKIKKDFFDALPTIYTILVMSRIFCSEIVREEVAEKQFYFTKSLNKIEELCISNNINQSEVKNELNLNLNFELSEDKIFNMYSIKKEINIIRSEYDYFNPVDLINKYFNLIRNTNKKKYIVEAEDRLKNGIPPGGKDKKKKKVN